VRERVFLEDDLAVPKVTDPGCLPCGLAGKFAGHLQQRRASDTTPVVTGHPTSGTSDSILIPHFATFAFDSEVTDVVLWERMPLETFSIWRPDDVTLDDVVWLVDHVNDVLATRALMRSGKRPSSSELCAAWDAGRYVSARLCLEMRDILSGEWAR